MTLERLTAVRAKASLLPKNMREYINILWLDAHSTELFPTDDVRIVETAERIIAHGLRLTSPEAARGR